MARLKLSEFRAKSLLVDNYQGLSAGVSTVGEDIKALSVNGDYIVKVDQGIKRRGKLGLIRLNVKKGKIKAAVTELAHEGFDRFIVEEMVIHSADEEKYLSIERTREGMRLNYSQSGGIEIESAIDTVKTSIYPDNCSPLSSEMVEKMLAIMDQQHMSLVELNPFLLRDGRVIMLDAAILVDSAGEYFSQGWTKLDIVDMQPLSVEEIAVSELNTNSPSAFSLRVTNPNGSLWLLLSGGGASIAIADEAQNCGWGSEIANYGEYSGGPTTEESYLYTKQVLKALLKSNATRKALVIAGGVANFTDVQQTFKGVIQALEEVGEQLKRAEVKVYVRRGGPNEATGLAEMEAFLARHGLKGSVAGSEAVLTSAINLAMRDLK